MKRMSKLVVLFVAFVTGCFWVRDHEVKWVEETSRSEMTGLGSVDSENLHWEKNLRDVDAGRRISIGFLPGVASANDGWLTKDSKTGEVSKLDAGTCIFGSVIGQAFLLCIPTLSSLFFEPFMEPTPVGLDTPMSFWGLMGCHRWKVQESSELLERGVSEDSIVAKYGVQSRLDGERLFGKAANGVKLYYEYPGFSVLHDEVVAKGAVAVAYPADSFYLYRKYVRSERKDHALCYKDVGNGGFGDGCDEIAHAQISYYRACRKLQESLTALYLHPSIFSASSNCVSDVGSLDIAIMNSMRENSVKSNADVIAAFQALSNKVAALRTTLDRVQQEKVQAAKKDEEKRLKEIGDRLASIVIADANKCSAEMLLRPHSDKGFGELNATCEAEYEKSAHKCWAELGDRISAAERKTNNDLSIAWVRQLIKNSNYVEAKSTLDEMSPMFGSTEEATVLRRQTEEGIRRQDEERRRIAEERRRAEEKRIAEERRAREERLLAEKRAKECEERRAKGLLIGEDHRGQQWHLRQSDIDPTNFSVLVDGKNGERLCLTYESIVSPPKITMSKKGVKFERLKVGGETTSLDRTRVACCSYVREDDMREYKEKIVKMNSERSEIELHGVRKLFNLSFSGEKIVEIQANVDGLSSEVIKVYLQREMIDKIASKVFDNEIDKQIWIK